MYLQSYCSQDFWKYKREEAFREYVYWFYGKLNFHPDMKNTLKNTGKFA